MDEPVRPGNELTAMSDASPGLIFGSYQWGLLRHDYTPKPAFEVYRRLIAELGRRDSA
jgi:hypothetical protein